MHIDLLNHITLRPTLFNPAMFTLYLKIIDILLCIVESQPGSEYCSYENFRPTCSTNEIIVITSAIYGRMNEGRCLELGIDKLAKLDPKYFGCSVDVLEFMDGKCSGRTECSVGVYDQHLRQRSSCYKGIDNYLEASFACVSGELRN